MKKVDYLIDSIERLVELNEQACKKPAKTIRLFKKNTWIKN